MVSNWLEGVIIAVILAGIAIAIFKGGAANPESTGALSSKLTKLDGDLISMKATVESVGDFSGRLSTIDSDLSTMKTKVGAVETRVMEFEQRAATKGDIERVEERQAGTERKLELLDGRLDTTELALGRIENDVASLKKVVDSIAEGLRVSNQSLHAISDRVASNAAITAQVPAFMERVLRDTATTAAKTDSTSQQVSRLYDIITTRGLSQ